MSWRALLTSQRLKTHTTSKQEANRVQSLLSAMNTHLAITYPAAEVALFCRRHGIRSLALFGSTLHGNSHADSDVDLLVEYGPDQQVGLFAMTQMELELTTLFGRPVDLRTTRDLSPYFRDIVLAEAQILYES